MASDDFNWASACMDRTILTEQEKALRDLFIAEYLVDYDMVAAAMRCGFAASFASDYAKKFMEEPYVRKELSARQTAEPTSEQDEKQSHKRKILAALLREAHNPLVSGASRVAALSRLAAIYGMDQPEKAPEGVYRGGVMQVPAIADLNDWQTVAIESQARLVEEARS